MDRKIRILFHIDELSAGGAEKVLCNLVNNMDRTKFDITVHTTYKCDARQFLRSGITYKYVFPGKTQPAQLKYRIENALGVFYSLHLKGDYDIEVAYLECGPTKVIAQSTNKKAVKLAWVHCDLKKRMGDDAAAFVVKTKGYYHKFDKVVCVSEDCKKSFEDLFGSEPEVLVVHYTIYSEEILAKSKINSEGEVPEKKGFTLVTCGRLTKEKNFQMLLKCIQELNNDQVYLWIIGEGEEHQNLQSYIDKNHLENRINLLGFHSNPYPILKKADLYVCSSKYEGYSTAVIEALLLGLPVITTKCAGMKEILGLSEYGLITDNDEQHFSEGLAEIISNPKLLQKYQDKAKERGQDLSGRRAAQETEYLFEKMYRE